MNNCMLFAKDKKPWIRSRFPKEYDDFILGYVKLERAVEKSKWRFK